MHERERLKPRTPHYWGRDPVACGGLKPFSVIIGTKEYFYDGIIAETRMACEIP